MPVPSEGSITRRWQELFCPSASISSSVRLEAKFLYFTFKFNNLCLPFSAFLNRFPNEKVYEINKTSFSIWSSRSQLWNLKCIFKLTKHRRASPLKLRKKRVTSCACRICPKSCWQIWNREIKQIRLIRRLRWRRKNYNFEELWERRRRKNEEDAPKKEEMTSSMRNLNFIILLLQNAQKENIFANAKN